LSFLMILDTFSVLFRPSTFDYFELGFVLEVCIVEVSIL